MPQARPPDRIAALLALGILVCAACSPRLIAEGNHPQADVFWSGDPVRPFLLVKRGLLPATDRPRSIRDLADPRFAGRAAIANPLFGTTTMHVAALFVRWGDAAARGREVDASPADRQG